MDFLKQTNLVLNRELWKLKKRKRDIKKNPQNKNKNLGIDKNQWETTDCQIREKQNFSHLLPLLLIVLLFNSVWATLKSSVPN